MRFVDIARAAYSIKHLLGRRGSSVGDPGREGERNMDMATILPYVVQAVGGAIGGNILGALTRGGGGVAGRSIIGALGGVAAAYAAGAVPQVGGVAEMWSNLIEGENGVHLSNLITGAIGGGVLGLIGGLLIRPRD
jgi:hypothetical protein